jgi:hypothetical protein
MAGIDQAAGNRHAHRPGADKTDLHATVLSLPGFADRERAKPIIAAETGVRHTRARRLPMSAQCGTLESF